MARPGIAALRAALVDLVLPRACAGCGVPSAGLCPRCGLLLTRARTAAPRRFPWGFPPTVAAGAYAGPVRAAVLAFKERGRAELAVPLGAALALAVAAVVSAVPGPPRPVALVPVPSSRQALRERGRDHVRELTAQAVTELRLAGLPAAEARLLRRRGRVRDSAGLSAAQRRANLAGTFERCATRGRPPAAALLVLVDDVVTTGSTLTEAAAVLSGTGSEGGMPLLAAVVAATPRAGREPPHAAGRDRARNRPEILRSAPLDRLSGPGKQD
ncbi:ComF family protein [Blastococcus deserti]|uniref:ComF family protein n=1 Tax=Blastococcus deserti TaxID=2259033 RepID=A0ABW4X4U9_9ACTN